MPWKPDYVTLAEAKAYLRVPDAVDDVEIALWITAASRAVDKLCNRQFGQEAAPVVRSYNRAPFIAPSGYWILPIDDLMDSTAMTVNGVVLASSGYSLFPGNAPLDGLPYTGIRTLNQPYGPTPGSPTPLAISARWGWTAVPSQVKTAVRLQLARWNFRRDSPAGIAGSPESGSEMRMLSRLDPDVSTSLMGLVRRRAVH